MCVEKIGEPGDEANKMVAAQDFRHTTQKEEEPVSNFICRLERTFKIAYGCDNMSAETRDTLLHGQLQESLCQNEERRLAELQK